MAKKRSVSSRRERRVPASEVFTKVPGKRELAELTKLAKMPDSKIDFSDAPERRRSGRMLVGRFYRPVKQVVSLRREMQTRPRG